MNLGVPVKLRWAQKETLLQFFHVKHPNHVCPKCASHQKPLVTVRKFGNQYFARFDCLNCRERISVVDWNPKAT